MITGERLEDHKIIEHTIFTYVDDTQHVVSSDSLENLENYMQQLHTLLIHLYRHKGLSINASKTEFMLFTKNADDNAENLHITDDKGNMLVKKKTIRVLGYKVNKNNTLDEHISGLTAKTIVSFNKIRAGANPMDL